MLFDVLLDDFCVDSSLLLTGGGRGTGLGEIWLTVRGLRLGKRFSAGKEGGAEGGTAEEK